MVVGGVSGEMGGPLMDELTNNIIALMAKLAGSHGNKWAEGPYEVLWGGIIYCHSNLVEYGRGWCRPHVVCCVFRARGDLTKNEREY